MAKTLFFIMLLALVSCTFSPVQKTTSRLEISGSVCSGTYVKRDVILTATHCFEGREPTQILVSGKPAIVKKWVRDSSDHILLVVDRTSEVNSAISVRRPQPADKIYFTGNANLYNQLYREGYIAGEHKDIILIDIHGWYGDSGAGVFDSSGKIVGTINFMVGDLNRGFTFMGMTKWSFDEQQLKSIGYSCQSIPVCKRKRNG